MLDEKDVKIIKELLKPLATKEDLKREIKKEIEGLAIMVNNSFNENEKCMSDGFKSMHEEFKTVNEKLDKKVQNVDKRMTRLEEALAIK